MLEPHSCSDDILILFCRLLVVSRFGRQIYLQVNRLHHEFKGQSSDENLSRIFLWQTNCDFINNIHISRRTH